MALQKLQTWIHGFRKLALIGVGNPLRHDDQVGLEIVHPFNLQMQDARVLVIESESVPENYLDTIVAFNPSHILILDAALLTLPAGTTRFMESIPAIPSSISTHTLPLHLFTSYLQRILDVQIGFLLIQPEDITFGEGLSPEIQATVSRIVATLREIIK
ncbi:MAG: hydrogenase maturation protease [Candidatus Bathyarchaeota archaeon]|nr:MAG: hydrogenase maturation protease [Candidatus Bathyarchaeota archaeon]